VLLSYKYRLEPNRTQAMALSEMLADFCGLYNAGLQQRIEAYRRRSVSVTYKMQAAELKAAREAAPELARWSFSAEQQCLRRLDKTYKAFFRRGYGFPRFRAKARYHAAEFRVGDGLTIRKSGKRLRRRSRRDQGALAPGSAERLQIRNPDAANVASGTSSFTSRSPVPQSPTEP